MRLRLARRYFETTSNKLLIIGFIDRHPDYIFISNSWEESISNREVFLAIISDHSPVSFLFVCFFFFSCNKMKNKLIDPLVQVVEKSTDHYQTMIILRLI